jgi:hypothetical protein
LNYSVVTPLLTGVSRFLTFMSRISSFLWLLRKVPVECLPSKHEVLSSNPSTAQKRKVERSSYWVVDSGFKFRIILPQHLECCDYRCELSHLGNLALFNKMMNFHLPNFYIFFSVFQFVSYVNCAPFWILNITKIVFITIIIYSQLYVYFLYFFIYFNWCIKFTYLWGTLWNWLCVYIL